MAMLGQNARQRGRHSPLQADNLKRCPANLIMRGLETV
jgi:hypothetical protein